MADTKKITKLMTNYGFLGIIGSLGDVAEWSKARAWKVCIR